MITSPDAIVRTTHRYTASAERVFDAWLDPARAAQFLFATAGGRMVRAEADARVGGRFCFVDRRGDVEVEHTGEYLVIDRPRELVFTFSVNGSPATTVAVTIVRLDRGCELRLAHTMPAALAAEHGDRARSGWAGILAGLARALGEEAA